MKLLFIGGLFDKDLEKKILKNSKSTVHYAANTFQWNIINGFINQFNGDIDIVSAPLIGSYPRGYRKIRFIGKELLINNSHNVSVVSFNNIWGYRNISRERQLSKKVNKYAKESINEKSTILVYSPHTPYLLSAVKAKKINPLIKICLVVPDLPEFMNLTDNISKVYKFFKKIDLKRFYKNIKYIDSFVLLTRQMNEKINCFNKPFTVVEGIVEEKCENSLTDNRFETNLNIVYTGTLNRSFGILVLLEAFYNMKRDDVTLVICGRGDAESVVKDYAKKDKRIIFFGQVSNQEAKQMQIRATVLVNPRQNINEFTKFSFPSKNIEYLLSGNPVISYKLDGIPEEYNDYCFYVEDNKIESLTKKIEHVLDMSVEERVKFGLKARNFVLREKNQNKVAEKIIKLIEN